MKYILCVLMCTSNFACGMEDLENKKPTNIMNVDQELDSAIEKKIKELEKSVSFYKGFTIMYREEIQALMRLNFFTSEVPIQPEIVIKILHDLFLNQNESKKEAVHPIFYQFQNDPESLRENMMELNNLVKNRNRESNDVIKELLENISRSFGVTQRMVLYYWKNISSFPTK